MAIELYVNIVADDPIYTLHGTVDTQYQSFYSDILTPYILKQQTGKKKSLGMVM